MKLSRTHATLESHTIPFAPSPAAIGPAHCPGMIQISSREPGREISQIGNVPPAQSLESLGNSTPVTIMTPYRSLYPSAPDRMDVEKVYVKSNT